MAVRILIFDNDVNARTILSIFLKELGFEVLGYNSPLSCELISRQPSDCPRLKACADAIITDMNMSGMSGLELISLQQRCGCHLSSKQIAVASATLSEKQRQELRDLGCRWLSKPFQFNQILKWARVCQDQVPPHRTLVPIEDLWKTAIVSALQ